MNGYLLTFLNFKSITKYRFINNKYASNKISVNLMPMYPKVRKISI
jgi:hypothetical protein